MYFVCSKNGNYKKSDNGKRKTDEKRPGSSIKPSKKINGTCLSRITASWRGDGSVLVWYLPKHTGHNPLKDPIAFLSLPSKVKEAIRQKGSMGVPIPRIIEGTMVHKSMLTLNLT